MPTDNHLNHPEQQAGIFSAKPRGFTLELQEPSDPHQKETWEQCRKEVWEQAKEVLQLKLEKLNQMNAYDSCPDLLEISTQSALSVADAWELTYKLRRIQGVIYAEPRFSVFSSLDDIKTRRNQQVNIPVDKDPSSEDLAWSLSEMHIQEAWKKLQDDTGRKPGEGVEIGHPDTGYLRCHAIETKLGLEEGFYFSESEEVPQGYASTNNPNNDLPANLGHGIATASLIISPNKEEEKAQNQISGDVIGVAYAAKLIPLRIHCSSQDTEVFSPLLATAINKAAELDVHIISISIGGAPSLAVRKAIINAQKKGIIVVASAGHSVNFAVWPAAYEQVVAVAASTVNGVIANFSSKSSRVDVAAPGKSVWCATVKKNHENGELTYTVERQSGTSFAAALVAGVAALWLSYHERNELVKQYGAWRIPLVFDKLLRQTCSAPPGWDKNNWGKGIVNAYKLLEARLPGVEDPDIQVPLAFGSVEHVLLDRGGFETFAYLFEQTLLEIAKANSTADSLDIFPRVDIIQSVLSKLLGKSGKDLRMHLRTFGQELAFHFGINSSLYKLMENALKLEAGLQTVPEYPLDKVRDELREHVSEYLKAQLPSTATSS